MFDNNLNQHVISVIWIAHRRHQKKKRMHLKMSKKRRGSFLLPPPQPNQKCHGVRAWGEIEGEIKNQSEVLFFGPIRSVREASMFWTNQLAATA